MSEALDRSSKANERKDYFLTFNKTKMKLST